MTSSPTPAVLPDARAREVLASVDRMPPTTSRTVFYPEETVIAAMLEYAKEATPPASDAAVPAGEATDAMIRAANEATENGGGFREVWSAMLAAAPKVASDTDAAASEAGEVLDRPALLAAARAWWAARMPGSTCTNVVIKGDGRVDVYWRDADEDGKYTLPVDFVRTALTTQGGAEG